MRIQGLGFAVVLWMAGCGSPAATQEAELPPDLLSKRPYRLENGRALYQGDIVLGTREPSADGTSSSSQPLTVTSLGGLWPNRKIPYVIASDLPYPERVHQAIAHWQEHTQIRFVPKTNEADYVLITHGSGCWSSVGRTGGEQQVSLDPSCDLTAAIHELGHTVGLWHEQSRFDRDAFVTVLWENIADGQEYNFGIEGDAFGPYDTSSVMHYASDVFSGNGQPTVVRKDGSIIPRPTALSAQDIAGVAELYNPRPACRTAGAIRAKHEELGGVNSLLGPCLTSEMSTTNGVGRYVHFEFGSIYWTAALGAHYLSGPIRTTWALLGWEQGPLGFPKADPQWTADGRAQYVEFENGTIYSNLWQGTAYEVRGAIAGKFAEKGGVTGLLGLPLSNERAGQGCRFNHFENGSIYWSPTTGAHEIHGAILAKWRELDWERSPLGLPVSDEHEVPGGRQSDFQHGNIRWEARTGRVFVTVR